MVEQRNQHYVPRHYLRGWAKEGQLDIYHIESENAYSEPVASVCSRNYFYGNPPIVEDKLGTIEGYHAHPLNALRETDTLTDLSEQYIRLLLSFVTTQRNRIKAVKEDINSADEFIRKAVKKDLQANQYENLIDWQVDISEEKKEDTLVESSLLATHHYLITLGIFGYIAIQDLRGLILYNATDKEFITSDVPIVHDNPQYKHNQDLVVAGVANRGIQIFCPINKRKLLLLYDPAVYRFDTNYRKRILIESSDVINELNLLQFHSAENFVIFRSDIRNYVCELSEQANQVQQEEEITMPLETEAGISEEVKSNPAYQIPKQSPTIPSCTPIPNLPYTSHRPTCQSKELRSLVARLLEEAGAPDLALIYSISLFEEMLELG